MKPFFTPRLCFYNLFFSATNQWATFPRKSIITCIIIMVLCMIGNYKVYAQWSGTTNIFNTAGGSVGVGAAPNTLFKFHVTGNGSTTLAGSLALFSSAVPATAGNLYGIAIDKNGANSLLLGVNKNSATGSGGAGIQIPSNSPFISSYTGGLSIGRGGNNGLPNTSDITITSTGNVGIGTNNPTQLLSVKGTILTTQLLVYPTTNSTYWPDYVFAPNYKLRSLQAVETFIRSNNHLPDVPSAEHIANNGIDVADNQKILLQKIEELTLYLIEQNKKIEQLKDKVKMLEAK